MINVRRALGSLIGMILIAAPLHAQEQVDFTKDVAPILEERCWYCHGEDEQESGLRLDLRPWMLRGGDSGLPAVVAGKPDESYLLDVINHVDPERKMPPDEDKLPAKEIALLTRWINEGAVWPGQMDAKLDETVDHWSFQPVQKKFEHDSIDAFLQEKLDAAGLRFSEPAAPQALIRRASIILTGLAPTPEQTEQFVEAFNRDADAAYAALVDELLASPHFGERWAQHWLDVIRWAETNGSESNMYRKNAWMYRDYVVRSFNEDKPYDTFIREQLAGDTMGAGDATGFLVAGPHVPAGTVGFEPTAIRQARADRMDEILHTVGASMMGVTIGCARCHNHKFDPITITDYYSLSAVFQDIEFGGRYPELKDDHPRVVREKQLLEKLESLRADMRKIGWGWIEDWHGYQEIRFPPQATEGLRLEFDSGWVMADEMEIFTADETRRNVAAGKSGTTIRENPATFQKGKPATKLVNGVFGTKQWLAKSPKGSKERPWLEFHFVEPTQIDTVRISTNREDFLETDYLQGMNKISYGDFRLAVQKDGNWKIFSATASMKKRASENEKRKALQEEIQAVIDEMLIHGRQPAFVGRFIEPAETFVFGRGSPENPRNKVQPAALNSLNGTLPVDGESSGPARRRALAEWIADPANPLTARVMVNRLWHHTFGTGIVSTPSDFGKAGATPTHPELLDWLAIEFVNPSPEPQALASGKPLMSKDVGNQASNKHLHKSEHKSERESKSPRLVPSAHKPFSMKRMIRMMVMSKAFRQSSLPNEDAMAKDGSSVLLWRFPPRRVDAEVIRDSILQASGLLDKTVGGPSYRIHNVKARYAQWEVVDNHGPETWRRMLYQERMRRVDDQMFTAFDFPDCGQVRARRPVSTTPLQALNLMNSDFVIGQSKHLAQRAIEDADGDVGKAVDRCFELLLSRRPDNDERQFCIKLAEEEDLSLVCRAIMNSNEFTFLP